MRSDLHYRLVEGERITSPVILNHRIGDQSAHIELVKKLIKDMYAENPGWLDSSTAVLGQPSP